LITGPLNDVKEWKVILATLVIFGAGVVTGGLLVHQTQRPAGRPFPMFGGGQSQPGQPGQFGQRVPPNEQRTEFLRHITRQLELTPEQRGKVETILSESQQRTKNLWEPVAAKMGAELRKTDDRIREVLTPEQQRKFDEMRARLRENREGQKMMGRPPGAPPEGGARRPEQFQKRPLPPNGTPPNPEPRPPGESSQPLPPPDRPQ
jgi:Spy/CpxP family protein refolding chaperone